MTTPRLWPCGRRERRRQGRPCSSHSSRATTRGRTPPCSSAIVEADIAELHASVVDPHPKVSGNGLARLREAGMRTVLGEGDAEARKVMEAYLRFITTGLPFVTAKFAMSLDGKIATRTGDSKWVTGQEARTYAHRLRASSDAVMVGINTVITDEPRLTARDGGDVPAGKTASPCRGRQPRPNTTRRPAAVGGRGLR